jgi:hypothetical protein
MTLLIAWRLGIGFVVLNAVIYVVCAWAMRAQAAVQRRRRRVVRLLDGSERRRVERVLANAGTTRPSTPSSGGGE